MRSKKSFLLLMTIVLLLSLLVGVLLGVHWYYSPGVNIVGTNVHIDLCRNGYIIHEYSGEVVGTTSFIITGDIRNASATDGTFKGYIQVESFPVPMKDIYLSSLFARKGTGIIHIYYSGNRYTVQDETLVPEFQNFAYWVYIDANDPYNCIFHVSNWEDSSARYYIVPGENEDDALRTLNAFMQEQYGNDY